MAKLSPLQQSIQEQLDAGKSGRAIERDANIAKGQITSIMGGGGVTIDTYRKLAPVLGKPLWWLLEIEQPPAADLPGSGKLIPFNEILFGGPNSINPRKIFDPAEIATLADSIFAHGLLQNPVVRAVKGKKHGNLEGFELLAGERRMRAVTLLISEGRWSAGTRIECKVVEANDDRAAVIAIAENIHREQLTPLEMGEWLEGLARKDPELWDNQSLAALIKKKVGFVQQHRRVFTQLPEPQKEQLRKGEINFTQARDTVTKPKGDKPKADKRPAHAVRGFGHEPPSSGKFAPKLNPHPKALKDVPFEFTAMTRDDKPMPREISLWDPKNAYPADYIRRDVVDDMIGERVAAALSGDADDQPPTKSAAANIPEHLRRPDLRDDDDLYTLAVDLVCKDRKASASHIQRHLTIGYNPAVKLLERMEAAGIVSTPNEQGQRTVIAPAPDEEPAN